MDNDTLARLDALTEFRCRAVDAAELLKMDLPPRENLLDPWLPAQGLAMIHAARGTGKTHVSLGIAYAVASGGSFLGWHAERPRGVLFIDGEMPANALQERLAAIVASAETSRTAPLRIITPDLQPYGMPDLASEQGQRVIDEFIDETIDLIVVDNLSTLVRSGKENEAESWQPVQTWALRLRAQGKSVLFVHHSGKGGQQRGTSRREDVLDTVIALKRPPDYVPEDGAAFEIHFEKARGFHGEDVAPVEAKLTTDDRGKQVWVTKTREASTLERVAALLSEGLSQKDVAIELGINKSNVSRHARKARAEGLIG